MTINQSLTYPNWLNNVLNVQKFPISKLTPVNDAIATDQKRNYRQYASAGTARRKSMTERSERIDEEAEKNR